MFLCSWYTKALIGGFIVYVVFNFLRFQLGEVLVNTFASRDEVIPKLYKYSLTHEKSTSETFRLSWIDFIEVEKKVKTVLKTDDYSEINVIGYGEFSLVFGYRQFAMKRMAARFISKEEVDLYVHTTVNYTKELENRGIEVLDSAIFVWEEPDDFIVYIVQPWIDESDKFSTQFLKICDESAAERYFELLADAMKKAVTTGTFGLDSQVSNWIVDDVKMPTKLSLIDVNSPMIRENGIDVFQYQPFLRTLHFVGSIVGYFFYDDLIDKYYDLRSNWVDVCGNLIKEKLDSKHLDLAIKIGNERLLQIALQTTGTKYSERGIDDDMNENLITKEEIESYYANDARDWAMVQFFRKIMKLYYKYVLWTPYPYLIPLEIER